MFNGLKLYPDNEHKPALVRVIDLHRRVITGEIIADSEWADAADAVFWEALSQHLLYLLVHAPVSEIV